MNQLDALLKEQAEIKVLADRQRQQHAIEYGFARQTLIKRVVVTVPQQATRFKARKHKRPQLIKRGIRDILFFNAGRYAAGQRDPKAVAAHFELLKVR